jgi:CDGSH-type Zn-finger protein
VVTIKVRQNGSLLVEGDDVKLVDWNGQEYVLNKRPFALCRCGQSKRKPFCDSSHKLCEFQAAEAAPGPNAAPPAEG